MSKKLCVLNIDELRKWIMMEAHNSRYSVHPGSTKMYHDLKEMYGWGGNEEEHCRIRGSVSKLSTRKSRTPKA